MKRSKDTRTERLDLRLNDDELAVVTLAAEAFVGACGDGVPLGTSARALLVDAARRLVAGRPDLVAELSRHLPPPTPPAVVSLPRAKGHRR